MRNRYLPCIEALYRCADTCDDAVTIYLRHDPKRQMSRFVEVALDCSELMQFAARFLTRKSELAKSMCIACIHACEKSAQEASRVEVVPLHDCADACVRCAAECRNVVQEIDQDQLRHREPGSSAIPNY